MWRAGRPRPADRREESESQPRGPQKRGPRYSSSREAATQESPARQCRVAKVEQSQVPEGRYSKWVTSVIFHMVSVRARLLSVEV